MKIINIDELKENIEVYHCGSQRLCHAIETQLGQIPINVYTHKNGKLINVFIMTNELSQFLTIWSRNNPNKEVKNE